MLLIVHAVQLNILQQIDIQTLHVISMKVLTLARLFVYVTHGQAPSCCFAMRIQHLQQTMSAFVASMPASTLASNLLVS